MEPGEISDPQTILGAPERFTFGCSHFSITLGEPWMLTHGCGSWSSTLSYDGGGGIAKTTFLAIPLVITTPAG